MRNLVSLCAMGLLLLAIWHHEGLTRLRAENAQLRQRLGERPEVSPEPFLRDALAMLRPAREKEAAPKVRRRSAYRNLDKLLQMPEAAERTDNPIITVARCQELEQDPERFHGQRVVAATTLSRFADRIRFDECANLDISLAEMSPQRRQELNDSLPPNTKRRITVAGRFRGLTLYTE